MFSSRLHWDLKPNPIAELLSAKRERGESVLDLTESNPTRVGFEYPSGLFEPDAGVLLYDPAPKGMLATREAVGASQGVPADRILLTASTSESYGFLFKLLCDPGDEVLTPRPSYPLFEFLASLESVTVKQYPLVYHEGWWLDFDELLRLVTPRTRAILLVNPNNPTGSYLKRSELAQLVSLANATGMAIISDEVFADYAFGQDESRVPTLATCDGALTFTLSGLSKVCALPQMKLGWITANGPRHEEALERLELIADTYLSVSTPIQLAAPRMLDSRHEMQRQIRERTQRNLAALEGRQLRVEGGWNATIQIPRTRSEECWVLDLLREENVLVQPGYFFDFHAEAYLVLSLLTAPETFDEGVRRILRFTAG
jgi:alanine-synthesizing transaminase